MSDILGAGIDFGNINTIMSVFVLNDANPLRSAPTSVEDGNGNKEPSYGFWRVFLMVSSIIYFDKGNRLSATSAVVSVCTNQIPNYF